ncbi:MAG: aldo/keto reductase [Candidatus Binataceae bacterium]
MIEGRATAAGTSAYAAHFTQLSANFRPMIGLTTSSIGLGTYLGEYDEAADRAYEDAIQAALLGGINLIDTAVNYRFQRSERNVGRALAGLIGSGELRRDQVIVATKGGYITFDGDVPPDPRAWFHEHFVRTGIVGPDDMVDGSHCMTPKWLATMLEMSRQNMGVETIDIYYLHNPETQLAAVSRAEFLSRVRTAFNFLESAVAAGKIAVYGAATWNGFRVPATDRTWLSLEELLNVARDVGGDEHHFRAIQFPVNLAMPEAVTLQNQAVPGGRVTILQTAKAAGIGVCASASLLQGKLSRGLPEVITEAFRGLATDAQRALQFVRSTPGVDCALVGMKSVEHVRAALATAAIPPASLDDYLKLFQRS